MNSQLEIIDKLRKVKMHLIRALHYLNSAGTWSIIDMFTSGFLSFVSDVMEYSEYGKAKREIAIASNILREIEGEVRELMEKIPEVNSTYMWIILDIGLDGFITDLMRHMKIGECKRRIKCLVTDIDRLISKLKSGYGSIGFNP